MAMLKTVFLMLLILAAAPVVGTAGAAVAGDGQALFGIPMGTVVNELDIAGRQEKTIFRLQRVPEPDRNFYYYLVRAHESTGVCLIIAQTDPIVTGPAGEELRQEFQRIMAPWKKQFGDPAISDYIIRGDTRLWAQLFMTKLRSNEAVLAAKWTYNNGNKMGDQISELLLIALPATHGEAILVLQARLNNYRDCIHAIRRDEERDQK